MNQEFEICTRVAAIFVGNFVGPQKGGDETNPIPAIQAANDPQHFEFRVERKTIPGFGLHGGRPGAEEPLRAPEGGGVEVVFGGSAEFADRGAYAAAGS